eukprot:gene8564-10534_t
MSSNTATTNQEYIEIKCLVFAKLKELLGEKPEIIVKLPIHECTTLNLIKQLKLQFPHIIPVLDVCLIAINYDYVEKDKDIVISSKDEIALIPPVSGGEM